MTARTADTTTSPELEGRLNERAPVLRQAWDELRAMSRFRALVRYLVSSSLRTENTGTVFGFVWWLLDPLLLMAVYFVLVEVILKRGTENYPVFILTAVLSWEFFSTAARNSVAQTIGKERLMRQIAFPKAVIPLSETLGEAFHFLFGLGVLVVFAIPFGILPHPVVPFVLVIAAIQFVFTLGVAYFVSALNVFFRDTQHLLGYLFRLWFYLSPSLYTLAAVPERYLDIYLLNPFATFFTAYRDVLLEHTVPDLSALGLVAVVSVVVLGLGYLYFVRAEPSFTKIAA